MRPRAKSRPRSRRWGQALVEFAIVFPIFMVLLMGLIDGGRLVYADIALSQAAREAARVAAVEVGWVGIPLSTPGCVANPSDISAANPGAHVCPSSIASMKAHVVAAANTMVAGLGAIDASSVFISCNAGQPGDLPPTGAWTETSGGNGCADASGSGIGVAGGVASVRIVYTFTPLTPVFAATGITTGRSGAATMVIN